MALIASGEDWRPDPPVAVAPAASASPMPQAMPARTDGASPGARDEVLSAYFAARVAGDEPAAAARGYATVLAAAPDPVVAARAYRAALVAGDLALATRAAAILGAAKAAPADAALFPIVAAARANDPAALGRAAADLAGTPLAVLGPALAGWARYLADGTIPAAGADNAVARRLLAEVRALLLLAAGRTDEGLAAIAAAGGGARPPIDLRVAAAQLLFGQGRDDAARRLLAGDDPVLARLRAGAAARATLAFGTARLLARVAGDLDGEATVPLRIALARTALVAEPGLDRARLLLADALADGDEPDLALAELAAVASASPWAPAAADARVAVLAAAARPDDALAAGRAAAATDQPAAWERYAGLLVGAGRAGDAIPWYRRLADGPDRESWATWAALGNALDEAGRWPEARTALDRAVALAPDEPLALNNAGYARVLHGERGAGIRLLERAARLAPDDTSVADALGWAYHLSGDAARALPLVERAARDQPGNAEIADHLGDVYWRLGRRYEARYAWAAARLVAAPAAGRVLAAKIEDGP